MSEHLSLLSQAEIEKQNQLLYERHRDAESEVFDADKALQYEVFSEIPLAGRTLSKTRKLARQAFEVSRSFYDEYNGVLYELAVAEDTARALNK